MSPGFAFFADDGAAAEPDGAGSLDGAPAALTFKGRAGEDEGGGMVGVGPGEIARFTAARRSGTSGTWHFH